MASSATTHRSPNVPAGSSRPAPTVVSPDVGLPEAVPRLAPLTRRRRPAVWVLGLALVCAGGALAAVMTLAAGGRVAVLSVVRPVAAGEAITSADLGVARVPTDPQLDPIPATERGSVVGQLADVDLRPGTLLTRVGERPYPPDEVARGLGVPVLAALPIDHRAAGVLSDGVERGRWFDQSALIRAARRAAASIHRAATASQDDSGPRTAAATSGRGVAS